MHACYCLPNIKIASLLRVLSCSSRLGLLCVAVLRSGQNPPPLPSHWHSQLVAISNMHERVKHTMMIFLGTAFLRIDMDIMVWGWDVDLEAPLHISELNSAILFLSLTNTICAIQLRNDCVGVLPSPHLIPRP